MKTTVVNIKDCPNGWETNPDYVYVGRPGRGLSGNYGNHHPIGKPCSACGGREHNREDAIAAFHRDVLGCWIGPTFREAIEKLRGKYLVCFCKRPNVEVPCHADVYVELLERTP